MIIPQYGFLNMGGIVYDYKTIDSTEARKNIIFADNLTFAFRNPQKNLLLIAFTAFSQTDKRLTGRDKFEFLVSTVYE